jgi:Na+/H+ antiporter NhaC
VGRQDIFASPWSTVCNSCSFFQSSSEMKRKSEWERVHKRMHSDLVCDQSDVCVVSPERKAIRSQMFSRAEWQGDENMLAVIAAVLIVLWLLGFFAFHVSTAFIHVALAVALILLVLHFMRARPASV